MAARLLRSCRECQVLEISRPFVSCFSFSAFLCCAPFVCAWPCASSLRLNAYAHSVYWVTACKPRLVRHAFLFRSGFYHFGTAFMLCTIHSGLPPYNSITQLLLHVVFGWFSCTVTYRFDWFHRSTSDWFQPFPRKTSFTFFVLDCYSLPSSRWASSL